MRSVAIYTRVSTDHQTTENQERELRETAARVGWQIIEVYRDEGVSEAKSREHRPGFDALCKDAARRRFGLVMAWSVDRLGRSLQDLVGFLSELHALGIDLFLHQQGLDTTTPAGKAMFQMMGVFAEFERSMIRERVNAGLRRAKAAGKTLGRRRLEDDKDTDRRAIAKALRAELQKGGVGIRKLAALHGVGVGTVLRIKADMERQFDTTD
jgi:DNA invertase Pin-like site-specific DNA recombinase